MALVHNNNLGVYAGVSKQAVDLRLPSHCEEMINCYPTIQYGVKRRNPSVQIGTGMFAENDTFTYAYDRGVALAEEEQYYISIDGVNGLRVFDVIDQVYRTVSLTGTSSTYITNASGYRSGFAAITVKDTTIITNRGVIPTMSGSATSDYDKKAFVWIKQVSVDTAFPYTFYLTLKETNGTTIATTSSAATSTTGVASALAAWADVVTGFTAVADGSVVKITRDNSTAFEVIISDTYGSQASSAWKGSIEQMADLPKLFPFKDTIVKIDGVQRNDDVAYWVKYDGNQWVEHRDPTINYIIDTAKMPHKLVRNADFTFTMSPITWDNLLVGDNDTQSIPEFIGSPVLDMFFVNGRLGLLTRNGISLSQQGNLYNFFRTTVLALLGDSAITTFVDSTRSVGLCYAVELQGLVILFGDKSQFYLDTSKALTPSTISIQPICQYEINTTLKPIFMNDSVFFVVTRSGYSSLMEMSRNTITTNVAAIDVSSHVSGYIDGNIVGLTALPRSNFICLLSGTHVNTVFTYKYHDSESVKSQMAWGKWTFNMLLKSIFSLGNKIYFLGARYSTLVPIEDYPLVVSWDDTKIWADETFWLESAVATVNKLEYVDLDSTAYTTFLDSGTVGYPSEIELSEWSLTSTDKTKELRGNLLIKTIDVSSTDGSLFNLNIIDNERGTTRVIPSLYTVNRKPFVSGNAKNMGIKIKSTNGAGFQIKSISLEGQYNVRSKRV